MILHLVDLCSHLYIWGTTLLSYAVQGNIFLKQSFIIWVRSDAVISEVSWYISALIPSGPDALVLIYISLYLMYLHGTFFRYSLSSTMPAFNLFATILYVMIHELSFILSSTYFFQVFSLAVRIAALYFWRQFRKAFYALSLISKSSILFSLFLHRFVCFFIFARSEVYHVIPRHPFILVLGIVFSQALVIQFVNSVVASFGLLERLDGSVFISSLRSCSQSAYRRLYDGLFNFSCLRSVLVSRSSSMIQFMITADLIWYYVPAYLLVFEF